MVLGDVMSFPLAAGLARLLSPATRPVLLPCAKVTSCLTLVLLICFETVLLSTVSDCTKSFYVHWNTTNPIFRIDNTDHIIDVNKGNYPFEYDQVNIICPVYTPGTHEEDAEKYIIYNVSKEEYDTCRITNPNPRIIAICDKPYKLMYFTITFRSFTPQPGGLEFQPGQDYYFISTSSKDDLHRRIGGRCSTNNMKVVFKVCCRPDEMHNNQISHAATTTAVTSVSTSTPVSHMPSHRPTAPVPHPTFAPRPPTINYDSPKPTTKKSSEYDKHPNEVVKNEELTYNRGYSLSPTLWLCVSVIVCCLVGR
ncbi:ephrin-B1 isoform X2 [Macrosteles quadrilineatus]|uniref:ephrin-B1 isoform X2 n=1 Tax=Macrosteles quadrilineatus TaxID=74068 RepID=UPI0023E2518E|nr:ephrin-B1 isoform X2 [Macrosteles quadrilineatus]